LFKTIFKYDHNIGLFLVISLVALFAGCQTEDAKDQLLLEDGSIKPRVITTVSPITSIVDAIGGERITLKGIVPEGVNSHTFDPAPSTAIAFSNADIIFLNGLYLEEPALDMALKNKRQESKIVLLGNRTLDKSKWVYDFSFPEEQGVPNPHLWTDPMLALEYALIVSAELSALDPLGEAYYQSNYKTFEARILNLDSEIKIAVLSIPTSNRKLLTYHDSFPYFAKRYGLTVIAAVQPSDFTEPSAREVAQLIDQVRLEKVPAIFGSNVFPSPVMSQIAHETQISFIDNLRDDDLPGSHGDIGHSYLGLMVENVRTIVVALGGDAEGLQYVDTSPIFQGESQVIYP